MQDSPQDQTNAPPPVILIVDDVVEIVEELLTMLELLGVPAAGAFSLNDALDALERFPSVRVICSDVRLGGDAGEDIVWRVGEHQHLAQRSLKFIFMTADVMRFGNEDKIVGCPVLMKPLKPADLIAAIGDVL